MKDIVTQSPGRPPRVRNLIAFSALIMLLFCIIMGIQATRSYDVAVVEGKQNAARLTRILSDHIEQIFLSTDLTLRRAVERQYFNSLFGGNLAQDMKNNLQLWTEQTPQIVAMALVNKEGVIEIATHKEGYDRWIDYRKKMVEEPAFSTMRDGGDGSFYVGKQNENNAGKKSLLLLSRGMTNTDGSFGGVVIAAIDTAYILDFFTSVEVGTARSMSLMLNDKTTLISSGDIVQLSPTVLKNLFSNRALNSIIHTDTISVEEAVKILSYKKIKSFPAVLSVVIDEEDFLAEWRKGRIKDIGFLAIFTVFGSVLSFFALTMAKQIVYVEESEAAAILASQAKSEFLANMSHELRTPLNAIIGFSEMMNSGYFGPTNPKQKERITDIHLCGTHLLQLITDILEFSKGDAGKLEINEEIFDVNEIVREVIRMMNEKIKSKSIKLQTDISDTLPHLLADKRKVRQILINLLSNAAKFTPEEGVVKVAAKLDQAGNLNLIVSDTGIGIAEEDIPTALSVFGQVHRSRSHEGTGLGLPLCKMFAELHGGKMALVSAVGAGTTVRVIFPAGRVVNEEPLHLNQERKSS